MLEPCSSCQKEVKSHELRNCGMCNAFGERNKTKEKENENVKFCEACYRTKHNHG